MNKRIFTLVFIFSSFLYSQNFILTQRQITLPGWNQKIFIGNVFQGITAFKNIWFFSQTKKDTLYITMLNIRNMKISQFKWPYATHAQDLSLFYDKGRNGGLKLITTSASKSGIAIFNIDKKPPHKISFAQEVEITKGISTAALSVDQHYLLTRNHNMIHIYNYKEVLTLKKSVRPLFSFFLSKKQQKKGMWFQGLTMKDGYIYTLSGNNLLNSEKYLIIYDSYGRIVRQFLLSAGKEAAQNRGDKWELEGLTFVGNRLITSVMSGKNGKNIKQLYEILVVQE